MKFYGNVLQFPAKAADAAFADCFAETLRKWGNGLPPSHHVPDAPTGLGRAQEALKHVEHALARLGTRKGPRADAARIWLTSHASRLRSAIDAFESIGEDSSGPAAQDLITRILVSRANVSTAEATFARAGADTVIDRQNDLVKAQAIAREVDRDLNALVAACELPSIPASEIFKQAAEDTALLAHHLKLGARPASTLELALEQGARAAGRATALGEAMRKTAREAARLWVCFEPAKTDLVYEMRWARFEEGAPEAATDATAPADDGFDALGEAI